MNPRRAYEARKLAQGLCRQCGRRPRRTPTSPYCEQCGSAIAEKMRVRSHYTRQALESAREVVAAYDRGYEIAEATERLRAALGRIGAA